MRNREILGVVIGGDLYEEVKLEPKSVLEVFRFIPRWALYMITDSVPIIAYRLLSFLPANRK